jgi:hypothetical protein
MSHLHANVVQDIRLDVPLKILDVLFDPFLQKHCLGRVSVQE